MPHQTEASYTYFSSTNSPYSNPTGRIWTNEQWSILKTLTYFDLFKYPLKREEIFSYSSISTIEVVDKTLLNLVSTGAINSSNGFYYLGGSDEKVTDRKMRNQWAEMYLNKAIRVSQWIFALSIVECVCLSGSLSKMDMTPKGDIDYFIIVKKNRVWVLRFLFSLVIKPLKWMGGRNRYLCPNYIIDIRNLEIRDKNYYTAIEISTLIPVVGEKSYQSFLAANQWIYDFLPNHLPKKSIIQDKKLGLTPPFKFGIVTLFNQVLYRLYKAYYKNKFISSGKFSVDDFELKFNPLEFKNHVNGHRNKILTLFEERLNQWSSSYPANNR